MRLLLIEDYRPLQKSLAKGLRETGFAVDITGNGEEGLWYAMGNDYDVIILDLMLPGMGGLRILKQLRAKGRKSHVLILTAKDTLEDRITGLDLGADDYLVKPFAFEELLARVRVARIRDVNEYQASLSNCLTISRNMQRMVDNLLMLARVDARQITFRREEIQPAKLVNSCWRSFSDRALERGIVFENRIPAEMTCQSDPDSLSMVLSNLLDNAVEYTNEGGQIRTTGDQDRDCVEITVANTGCQLTNEEISQALDCFWRRDSSHTETGAHYGLGLALVQRLVRALGGCTTVELLRYRTAGCSRYDWCCHGWQSCDLFLINAGNSVRLMGVF